MAAAKKSAPKKRKKAAAPAAPKKRRKKAAATAAPKKRCPINRGEESPDSSEHSAG